MPAEALFAVRVIFVASYLAILVIDLRTRRIPNLITYPLLVLALAARPDGIGLVPVPNLLAAAAAFAAFVLFAIRGWMGMGDAKLAALIALAGGPALGAMALWGAFVAGGLVGVVLLATRRVRRGDAIAFGPFLAAGGALAAVAPEVLLERSPFAGLFG